MSTIHRRQFLKSCGVGAVGLMGLGAIAQPAQANWQLTLATNNFTNPEVNFIRQSMGLLARHFTTQAVFNDMVRVATNSSIYGPYAQAIGMPGTAAWSAACFGYQMAYYLRRRVPRIQLRGYYSRENAAARADVGVVRTLDITRRTGRTQGEFLIHVNRHAMGQQLNNPIGWAGVFAHEMMHSLGHLHGPGEYGNHLQINAIVPAVVQACMPAVTRNSSAISITGDYEEITRNQRFCGCSAS